ncbi:hypothetical protein EIP74_07425 [Xylella fastidiosa subsp. pauca]|nr:hypothetical protein EIP74_07425 [Xylella fastidiosa subsp. pauca]
MRLALHRYLGRYPNEFGQSWTVQLPLMRAFRCLSGQRVMWSFGYVSLLNECNVECLQCSLWFGLLITRVDVCAGQSPWVGWAGAVWFECVNGLRGYVFVLLLACLVLDEAAATLVVEYGDSPG